MRLRGLAGLGAVFAIALALWQLHAAGQGCRIETRALRGTPVTVFRPPDAAAHPVVLIAHGFAGSQQLMQSFALTLARNGYVAVSFDFPGHGRNPHPLTGSITELDGATRRLLDALAEVAAFARPLGDGRIAVLGHSMASDIVVRYAERHSEVAATIAVSMFSPAVTAQAPRNLLVIVGDWEPMLKREALRAVGLATAPVQPEAGRTYGDFAQGTARRVAFSAHVEHASVLFSQDSLRESLAWLDQTFGVTRAVPPALAVRGPWIMLLLAAVVLLGWPLAGLLPQVSAQALGAGLPWRRLALPLLLPMVCTPLLLRHLPVHVLPVLVGDYLALHFFSYGLLTAACLAWCARRGKPTPARTEPAGAALPGQTASAAARSARLLIASAALVAFGIAGLVWPIDTFVTAFLPAPHRVLLLLAMLAGTLPYFLADEWMTRGPGAARGAYAASKLAFLLSLGAAVALDFERLFFLVIIVPIILLFFLVYGLFSRWTYPRTGHPWVAGIASALAFAWAIGVSFPLLAG